jgi:hypothetical protein
MSYLQSGEKLYIKKETTPSAAVTGTLTETQVYALTIPANSFSAVDKFVLDNLIVSRTGTAATATLRVKLSTSSTMPAGTTGRIADIQLPSSNLSVVSNRLFNINGGVIVGLTSGLAGASGYGGGGGAITNNAFDPTVTNYLYISVILGNTGDSVTVHGYTLKNF